MDADKSSTLRLIALDTYLKMRAAHPHMPSPDSDEGQRKIDRLFDILSGPFRGGDDGR